MITHNYLTSLNECTAQIIFVSPDTDVFIWYFWYDIMFDILLICFALCFDTILCFIWCFWLFCITIITVMLLDLSYAGCTARESRRGRICRGNKEIIYVKRRLFMAPALSALAANRLQSLAWSGLVWSGLSELKVRNKMCVWEPCMRHGDCNVMFVTGKWWSSQRGGDRSLRSSAAKDCETQCNTA